MDCKITGVQLFIFKSRYFKYMIITEELRRLLFIYTYYAHTCCDDFLKIHHSIFLHCLLSGRNSVIGEKRLHNIEYSFFFQFQDERLKFADDKTLSEHLKLPIQRINDYQLLLKVSQKI